MDLVAGLIILGVVFLILLLLFMPMRFGIRYEKTAALEKIHVYVSVFGILIRIPIHNKEERGTKNTDKDLRLHLLKSMLTPLAKCLKYQKTN